MNSTRRICEILLLSTWVIGCASTGGQTGDETGEPCRETPSVLALDELSPLGFAPDQVLATTGASSTAPVTWLTRTAFTYGPESGSSSISFSLQYKGARYVASEARPSQTMALPICTDRVELDVDVTCTTTGGALGERFDAVLLATQASDVWLSQLFEPSALEGTLAIDPASLGDQRLVRLVLEAHFQPHLLTGGLSAGIEHGGGDSPKSRIPYPDVPLACIGDDCTDGSACNP